MKRTFISILLISCGYLIASPAGATNLVQVYNKALTSDPAFKVARATWYSERENITISRAALLPSLTATGEVTRGRNYISQPNATYNNTKQQYGVTLSQPLFNLQGWASLSQAHSGSKAAAATFSSAAQNLISRVATAYFGVLEAQDVLRYTVAQKIAVGRQLARTKQRYKVGLVAITDVYQARASYDSIVATEIATQTALANSKESLREITGEHYANFAKLAAAVPLLTPKPANIDRWVAAALKQNYSLQAAHYSLAAAHANIGAQEFGRFPTINAQAQGGYAQNSNLDHSPYKISRSVNVGVTANFPVIQGGLVSGKANQALYDYQKAAATLEQTRRKIVSQTRQDYLAVVADVSKVKADKQAVKSSLGALHATQAGYTVGTQTMVDVLTAQSNLYNVQTQLAKDQYDFILKTVALKYDAGLLSITDLEQINGWLAQPRINRVKKVVSKKVRKPAVHKKMVKAAPSSINQTVLKLNQQHYTLQLMAGRSKNRIMKFVNEHKITAKTYCITVKQKGKTWYKLIAGDYVSLTEAKAEARRITHTTHVKPWIRKLATIW